MTPLTSVTRRDFHRAMRLVMAAFAIMFVTNMVALVKAVETSNQTSSQTTALQKATRRDALRACRVFNSGRLDQNSARAAIRHFLVVQHEISLAVRSFQQIPPAERPLRRKQDAAIRELLRAEHPLHLLPCKSSIPST